MNYTTQVVNTIKDNINESIEKSLIDIDLESMFKYKIDFEKQQQEIIILKKEKNELIQEMDNFKKVSILKSMTEQIDEKNREIKILKSIIKNKEKTIETLKKNDKSNFLFEESKPNSLTSELSSESSKEVQNTAQTIEPPKEVLETNEIELIPKSYHEESTSEEKEASLEATNVEPESEDNNLTLETSQEESTLEEKELSLEITKDAPESEDTELRTETPQKESISEEKELSLEVTKDEPESEDTELRTETPQEESTSDEKEPSSKMVSGPDQTEEMKVIKKLKGKNYYLIKNTIFEIKNNKKVGDKVGVCIIEGKKKKYKFTNKK